MHFSEIYMQERLNNIYLFSVIFCLKIEMLLYLKRLLNNKLILLHRDTLSHIFYITRVYSVKHNLLRQNFLSIE